VAPLHTLNKTERKIRRPVLLYRCEDTSKLQIEYLINEIRCDSSPTPLQKSILLASSGHFLRLRLLESLVLRSIHQTTTMVLQTYLAQE